MAQKPPVDPALVDALLTLDDQFCFALHAASRVMVREDERELLVRVTAEGLALKQQACQVPLSLIQNSPISLQELLDLRDQLKRVRAALAPLTEDEEPA